MRTISETSRTILNATTFESQGSQKKTKRKTMRKYFFFFFFAHIDFIKEKKKLLHSGEMNGLNPVGLCGHGMWLGTPNTGAGSARCKGMFEGHSVASLDAQMGKNPSDRELPSQL